MFATLDDLHRYTPGEIVTSVEQASEKGAMPVTTKKAFVRLPDEARPMVEVLGVRLSWADAEALDRVLLPLLAPA